MSNAKKELATDDVLFNLMDGDDFVPVEERRMEEAERRRLERKRRLQDLIAEVSMPEFKRQNQDGTLSQRALLVTTGAGTVVRQAAAPLDEREKGASKLEGDDMKDDNYRFDMFSRSISPVVENVSKKIGTAADATACTQQDWDDLEGYYKAVIGEILTLGATKNPRSDEDGSADNSGDIIFRVSGVIGKGVFSTVLKCTTISNATSFILPPAVAIKCIRHNETMAKTAYSEIQFLQRLNNSPGIVPLLLPASTTPLEHRGHVLLVFPCADYNLRDVLQKFGKGVGLSLEAVRSYFGQLLAAATHLKKHAIIHSDLKPDNILVSADFSCVQLGDFGSALDVSVSSQQQQPTPYLVSRFYRAPEIILGFVPTYAIDLWSLAVSVAEIFLGDIVFHGGDNNSMILRFMQHIGPFSNRMIRQHLVQCGKMPISPHFTHRKDGMGSDYLFAEHTVDPVTGKPVNKYISLISNAGNNGVFPSTPLSKRLLKAKSVKDSRTQVLRFSDLLQKCLVLDPSRRISLKDALQHELFTKSIAENCSITIT